MTAADVVARFQADEQRLAASTAAATARRWSAVDPDRIVDSWAALSAGTVEIVAASQIRAAERGSSYTLEVLAAQGDTPQPAGRINARSLAGVASDGRPLDTLLSVPATTAVGRIGGGMAADDALMLGRRQLATIVATQVLDAARVGSSVTAVVDKQVFGYLRQINPGACSRCAVLAGKWYGWNDGFSRHPNCACVHVPYTGTSRADRAGLTTLDPQGYFDSLTAAEQDRTFTAAGAQAIRDGADISQVVNARRGMKTTTAYGRRVRTTTVGTGRRNTAFTRAMRSEPGPRSGIRLMPEQIYADAADRDDAIRLLRRFGYIS